MSCIVMMLQSPQRSINEGLRNARARLSAA
jgi:hypothetical protein